MDVKALVPRSLVDTAMGEVAMKKAALWREREESERNDGQLIMWASFLSEVHTSMNVLMPSSP